MQATEISTKTKWVIDPAHSEIGFKVKHLVFSTVRGTFREFDADIYTMGSDFSTVEIDVRIDAASVNTHNEQRDAHLRSADFFDVEEFAEIKFAANRFKAAVEEGQFLLSGQLTMKGTSKPVTLEVESGGFIKDPWGNEKALFTVSGKINRKDWGLNYNAALEAGGVLVGEDISISCEIQLVKQG